MTEDFDDKNAFKICYVLMYYVHIDCRRSHMVHR